MTVVRITLGIDEAGRGPAIGPMVLAAVALDTRAARALTRAGLADSKTYGAGDAARAARAAMADRVRDRATHVAVAVVPVDEIDRRVARHELNVLEREVAARLIDGSPPRHRIVADGARMFRPLTGRFPELEAYDEGESRHAAVAAASVVAKVERDAQFEAIRQRYLAEFPDIHGGGYVNAGTRRFLRAFAERHGRLLPEARRSWPHPYLIDLLGESWMLPAPQCDLFSAPADTP
jgi:ribonuclease HII